MRAICCSANIVQVGDRTRLVLNPESLGAL